MFSELAFFSFIKLSDQTQHRAYNEWHQLDHRPENLALPGVAWGDRWARTAEHADVASGQSEIADVDYVSMYWFNSPVDEALAEWDALGEASFQWGRGPLMPGVQRPMLAFFRPVKGYAAPRALVSPDVLPYRPNRGLHVSVSRFAEPHGAEAHAAYAREDRELIPALLDVEGVAGAWTFSFSHAQRHTSLPLGDTPVNPAGSIRIRLLYLEAEPLEVAPQLAAVEKRLGGVQPGEELMLSTPVKTIIPWQDW